MTPHFRTLVITVLICSTTAAGAGAQRQERRSAALERVESAILAPYAATWYTTPAAINNRGEIAGWATNEEGEWTAWIRSPRGRYTSIADRALPRDLNDRGEVVGLLFPCDADACWLEGFAWDATGGLRNLGSFLPFSVNERGDMAGVCEPGWQACVMRDGAITAIAGPGSEARGINRHGEVVGLYGDNRAFHLSAGWTFTDIGRAVATDISDRGVIAGHRWVELESRGERAMLTAWTRSGPISPAREVGIAITINRPGWVLAYGFDENEQSFSYIWNPSSAARLLLVSTEGGWVQLADVNDRGEVVGRTGRGPAIWTISPADMNGRPAGHP